jgi:hypothetical protein
MLRKKRIYARYGVEEYYEIDPEQERVTIWCRVKGSLRKLRSARVRGYQSRRLGIRFEGWGTKLTIIGPDGQRFLNLTEAQALTQAEKQRAETERQRAETEKQRADALAAKLRELGIDPETLY